MGNEKEAFSHGGSVLLSVHGGTDGGPGVQPVLWTGVYPGCIGGVYTGVCTGVHAVDGHLSSASGAAAVSEQCHC